MEPRGSSPPRRPARTAAMGAVDLVAQAQAQAHVREQVAALVQRVNFADSSQFREPVAVAPVHRGMLSAGVGATPIFSHVSVAQGAVSSAVAAAAAASAIAAAGGSMASHSLTTPLRSSSKWGEVVTSLPVMRMSNQSAASEPRAPMSPQPSTKQSFHAMANSGSAGSRSSGSASRGAHLAMPSTPPKLQQQQQQPQQQNSSVFWKRHQEFALARSQEAARERKSIDGPLDPSPHPRRLDLVGRSGLHDESGIGESMAAVSGLTGPAGSELSGRTAAVAPSEPVAASRGAAWRSHAMAAVAAMPPAEINAWQGQGPSECATGAGLWLYPANSGATGELLGEPLPPCLSEMIKFLRRRVEEQGTQVAQIRSEMAARTRVVNAFRDLPVAS